MSFAAPRRTRNAAAATSTANSDNNNNNKKNTRRKDKQLLPPLKNTQGDNNVATANKSSVNKTPVPAPAAKDTNAPAAASVDANAPDPAAKNANAPVAASVDANAPAAVIADANAPAVVIADADADDAKDATATVIPATPDAPAPDAVIAAPAPDDAIAAPAPDADKCLEQPSLFSTINPDCIKIGPQPQFHDYMEAAIELPVKMISEAGAEMAGDALKATENDVLVEIATKKALGLEDAELLNTMSEDPKVAAALNKFKTNMSHVVENGLNDLGETLIKPAEKAAEKITTGIVTAGTSALASVTGPLVPLATLAGTVGELVNDATEMKKAVEDATNPVKLAMTQITGVTDALDEAQKNAAAAASGAAAGATNAAASGVAGATNAVNDAAASGVAGATNAAASATNAAASGVKVEANAAAGGGSRKRRRIHKLSRRIERTLRRVQKKYGLKDDKNDFLRRTLKK